MWEAAQPLHLSKQERELLQAFARAGSTPQKVVLRIRIVLLSAKGVANHRVARELGTSRPTVLRWRRRFEQAGLQGLLEDAPRPGRKRKLTAEKEEAIVNATLYSKPTGATHWSVRALARAQRVSPATVYRVWRAHRLQPHRVKRFKLSTDPQFFSQTARHRRPIPAPSREGLGVERGRKEPDSSFGSHPAGFAFAPRNPRTANP